MHPAPSVSNGSAQWFTTTHWSVVLRAREGGSPQSQQALEQLCATYWPPLYSYIRRAGYHPHDAQDLTQEFLSRLVEKEWLSRLQDQRGKFRSFLLTFLKHFLSDERDRAKAQKRGGQHITISLDAFEAEERASIEPSSGLTAEQIYERRWATSVLMRAIERLRADYYGKGRAALFEQLKDVQPGERGECGYAEIGASLGLSEQAIKNAVHSFRRRHREFLRDEIAQTVSDPADVEDEIRHLLNVFSR